MIEVAPGTFEDSWRLATDFIRNGTRNSVLEVVRERALRAMEEQRAIDARTRQVLVAMEQYVDLEDALEDEAYAINEAMRHAAQGTT